MLNRLFLFLFRKNGWRILGKVPRYLPKAIWVVAPHHSNKDFFLGLGARAAIGIPIGFLAKKELFRWYSAWIFRGLGGFRVDRSRASNLVADVADTFAKHDVMHIAIAPEGTRKDVAKLRTGFYFMALRAGVPLVLVGFDYPGREVVLGEPFYPSGDFEKDMQVIYRFFTSIRGKRKTWLRQYEETGRIPPRS